MDLGYAFADLLENTYKNSGKRISREFKIWVMSQYQNATLPLLDAVKNPPSPEVLQSWDPTNKEIIRNNIQKNIATLQTGTELVNVTLPRLRWMQRFRNGSELPTDTDNLEVPPNNPSRIGQIDPVTKKYYQVDPAQARNVGSKQSSETNIDG